MKSKFNVTGMTCSACSAHVQRAVEKVEGVTAVSVSLLTNSMVVEHLCDAQNIVDAVAKAGYGATVHGQTTKEPKVAPQGVTLSRLLWSLGICLLLMYVSMGHMINAPLPPFLSGANNAVNFAFAQFLLCLPVWYLNRSYFVNGFKRLFSGALNMDSLIALGSVAGGLYGVFIIFILGNAIGKGDIATVETYRHQLYFESSAMILALVDLGKYFEGCSKLKTGDALAKLKKLAPSSAILWQKGEEITVDSAQIKVGDVVVVKAGMTIPADGKIVEGSCFVDQSAISGESIPVEKQQGDAVIGGTILAGGYVLVEVCTVGDQSALAKIISLVETASASKAPIQKLADKISAVFVPIVMAISLVTLIVWLAVGESFYQALDFAISVLVVSCPCALGLATPVAIMVSTGKMAQNGILVKNGEVLQKLSTIQRVVFDKTGTITLGKPYVCDFYSTVDKTEFFTIVGGIEKQSEHPLGKAVVTYAEDLGVKLAVVTEFSTQVGRGVVAKVDSDIYAIGNARLMSEQGVDSTAYSHYLDTFTQKASTCLIVSKNQSFWGIIAVGDQIKDTSKEAVATLKKMGIDTILLTGDNNVTAQTVCSEVGIDTFHAEVLPSQKAEIVQRLQQEGPCAMVGDGINDAPALATADVGFAVASGTDIAIDSADVVLIQNDLQSLPTAISLSKKTVANVKQNLFWAFFYNALGIPIATGVLFPFLGIKLSPMLCALAMSCSSLFVVTNALRLRFFKGNKKQTVPKEITMKYLLKIDGMMCSHCTGRVQKTLEAIVGVNAVEVSLENKCAIVTAEENIADILKTAVENQGYPVLEVTVL